MVYELHIIFFRKEGKAKTKPQTCVYCPLLDTNMMMTTSRTCSLHILIYVGPSWSAVKRYLFPSTRMRKYVCFGASHGRHSVKKCWMKKESRMND